MFNLEWAPLKLSKQNWKTDDSTISPSSKFIRGREVQIFHFSNMLLLVPESLHYWLLPLYLFDVFFFSFFPNFTHATFFLLSHFLPCKLDSPHLSLGSCFTKHQFMDINAKLKTDVYNSFHKMIFHYTQ